MNDLYETLFCMIDSGKKLVLPTENAARSLLECYVREKKCSVSFSSCIAFDRFREMLFKRDSSKKPADSLVRLLFSKSFVSRNSDRIRYFIPDSGYEELKERIVYYIASLLPSFDEDASMNSDLEKDVRLLKESYEEFLDKAGYYEPSYIRGLENMLNEEYVLLFPSSSLEMLSFLRCIRDKRNISIYEPYKRCLDAVEVYENEKIEIRNTFLKIKELVKGRVPLDRIILTVSGYERLRPYIEREAYLFDIPLNFIRGKSALEYPAGKIFRLMKDLYDNDYDIKILEKLLLDQSLPLRDAGSSRRFVLNAIERGISRATGDKVRYSECDVNSVYHDLKHYVDSINATSDPDYLVNQVKSLFQKLLKDEQFTGNAEDERVLSHIMDSLLKFSSYVKEFKSGSLLSSERLFPLFLHYMDSQVYVPQEKVKGVKVYPLKEDAGVYSDYRFIIALNETDARLKKKNVSPLSDYEMLSERDEIDITGNLLSLYKEISGAVTYSASINTYNGYSLPLTEFAAKTDGKLLKDPIGNEHNILKEKSIDYDLYPLTKLSYENASDKALALKRPEEDAASEMRAKGVLDPASWTFSSSQADKFSRCPYLYLLDYVMHLSSSRPYEIEDFPYFELGNALHKVIELYYKNGGGDVDEKVDEYLGSILDLWQVRKELGRDLEVRNMDYSALSLTDETRLYIESKYRSGLIRLINEINSREMDVNLEVKLEGEISSLLFKGYSDAVLIDEDGKAEIMDFKSTKVPSSSMQFDIYRFLLEKSGTAVASAHYATIKDGKVKKAYSFSGNEELEKKVAEMGDKIKEGEFKAVNSASGCKDCRRKGICRRRFFVR